MDINQDPTPEWTVVLSLHGTEICIVASFQSSPTSSKVVVACEDRTAFRSYAEMLRTAAFGCEAATGWEFRSGQGNEDDRGNEKSVPPWEG